MSPHNYYFTFRINGWWRKVRSIIHHWTERTARGEISVSSDQKASLLWRVRITNYDGQGPVFFTSVFCWSQIKYFFIPFRAKHLNPHFRFFFKHMPQGGIKKKNQKNQDEFLVEFMYLVFTRMPGERSRTGATQVSVVFLWRLSFLCCRVNSNKPFSEEFALI